MGYLIVKLIRATNLPSKKIGSMDPYVVMEIENCRSISPVREDCLEPEWKLTYRYTINMLRYMVQVFNSLPLINVMGEIVQFYSLLT